MRDPSLLVYFRPSPAASSWAATSATPRRGRSTASLPTSTAGCSRRTGRASSRCSRTRSPRSVARRPGGRPPDQRPEAFTPDNEFILGPTDVRGFWVAAGFCAHGLAGAGGMGRLVAEWILEGPEPRRLGDGLAPVRDRVPQPRVHARAHGRGLLDVLRRPAPRARAPAGRPLRTSPTYARLQELGAAFGEKSGWERPNWFEPNAAAGDESLRPRGWAGRLWSPAIGAEHRATRETAALFDETSFGKIEVSGEGSADFLERLCANRVARDVGAITYTSMLNTRGGIGATSRSRASRTTASGSSPARRSGSTTSRGSASTRRTTAPSRSRT